MGKFYSILKHVHVEDLKGNLKLNSTRDIVRFGNSSKLKVCSVIFVSLFEVGLLQSKSIFFLPPLKGEKKKKAFLASLHIAEVVTFWQKVAN